MLSPTYDIGLVLASVAVSLMAAFTGLALTKGVQRMAVGERKKRIAMAALAFGGGIWSMHFVAMLAMTLPVPIGYDPRYTLGSALIAILMAGIALIIMHFARRSWINGVVAGTILGNGIVAMHYVGMSGMRGCLPVFYPTGVVLAVVAATASGIAAIQISYSQRTTARIVAGTLTFGLSVVFIHFLAIAWTGFEASAQDPDFTPLLENGTLALVVMLSAFVICGTFLLSSTTFLFEARPVPGAVRQHAHGFLYQGENRRGEAQANDNPAKAGPLAGGFHKEIRLPYERDKKIHFIAAENVVAIRAEGHYTFLYTSEEKLFCPWSISVAEERLPPDMFLRTHRSYLVNMRSVTSFQRHKDSGSCLFEKAKSLKAAPVSRSHVNTVKEVLGL